MKLFGCRSVASLRVLGINLGAGSLATALPDILSQLDDRIQASNSKLRKALYPCIRFDYSVANNNNNTVGSLVGTEL